MAKSLEEARKDLDEEYRKVREDLEEVRMAMIAVDQAGPEDDLYDRLDALENAAGNVRTGGFGRRRSEGTPQGTRAVPRDRRPLTTPSPRAGGSVQPSGDGWRTSAQDRRRGTGWRS